MEYSTYTEIIKHARVSFTIGEISHIVSANTALLSLLAKTNTEQAAMIRRGYAVSLGKIEELNSYLSACKAILEGGN